MTQEAVIIDCWRTPVGKAPQGALRRVRPDDLAAQVVRRLLQRFPQIAPEEIEDLYLGCAMPEAEAGMNLARQVVLRAGLPDWVPGVTINRFCASGLQAIAMAADRIRAGGAHIILAGGAESMSLIPRLGHAFSPNPWFVEHRPEIYMTMGLTAERLGKRLGIGRDEQDDYAYASHQKALAAQESGRFQEEIVPVEIEWRRLREGRPSREKMIFQRDEGPRKDTSREGLARLKPVFDPQGTVTAGNASQTSDGASMAIVMSAKRAAQLGLKPLARFVSYAVAGVPPDLMGIAPAVAIPKALALGGVRLQDIDLVELNEAFAVQTLSVLKKIDLDPEVTNVNGGAIALGHPLGATGARLTSTLLHEMKRRNAKYGLVTLCVGGGQGAAGIFEHA